ncbi:hypothetical protein HCN44_002453 [Aphidius gifuensis]|uniref:Uncharacterized protein n=1 Tax=Aphidius gifuensis TaxID=684658 RepID=A0A834Y344_APHGI|nr:hypothetical protein HCN44_002453 [Aphidius gifuensis]
MAVGSFPPCIPRINMTKFFCCDLRSGSLFLGYLSMIERRLCCCFKVETGSLILGNIGLILSVIIMFGIPIILTKSTVIPKLILDHLNIDNWYPYIIAFWVLSIVSVLFNLLLVKGVLNEKPKLMFPWIYGVYISLMILALVSIGLMVGLWLSSVTLPYGIIITEIIAVIGSLSFLGISYYFFGVVVSHCQDLIFIQQNDLAQYTKPYSLNYEFHNY